jgi:hypothetical protein
MTPAGRVKQVFLCGLAAGIRRPSLVPATVGGVAGRVGSCNPGVSFCARWLQGNALRTFRRHPYCFPPHALHSAPEQSLGSAQGRGTGCCTSTLGAFDHDRIAMRTRSRRTIGAVMTTRPIGRVGSSDAGRWQPGLWHFLALAAAGILLWNVRWSASSGPSETWYRLTSMIPGEKVPSWLHKDAVYQGVPTADRTMITLLAPDSSLTATVRASVLVEVSSPVA